MSTSAPDIDKFSSTFDGLLNHVYPQNSKSISNNVHKILYEILSKFHKQNIHPKNCKYNMIDLIKQIEKSIHHSQACEQLLKLIKEPKILGLIEAYEEVIKQHCNVTLPDLPIEKNKLCSVKVVQLVKGSELLGMTIKYNPDGSVYVARVIPGGAAERSGMIQVGDRILSINEEKVDSKEPKEIVAMLNSSEDGTVLLHLTPLSLRSCLSMERFKTCKYLKAMVDYDSKFDPNHPSPELGFSFFKGDILELLNVINRHWAQAKHYEEDPRESSVIGIIPTDEQLSLDESCNNLENYQKSFVSWAYEPVCQILPTPDFIRTLVFIGPPGVGRNELKRRLLSLNPAKYASPVPHTSRPPRPHENDGIDYHFASQKQMNDWLVSGSFIESGEYNGNIYGTLDEELLRIISQKQNPVINAHPTALRTLRTGRFNPLIVFVSPPDLKVLKVTRSKSNRSSKSNRKFTDNDFQQMINIGIQLEENYGHFFDAKIVNDNLDTAFENLVSILHNFEVMPNWIPVDWLNYQSADAFQNKL